MRHNYRKIIIPLLAVTLLFAYCKKGDTGATGAAGPQGPQGQPGGTGPQGPKGDTGTANVIYSEWLDVAYEPDTVHNGAAIDTLGFFAHIPATKLDSAILANGEIKVYLNLGSAAEPAVVPLPYWDVYSSVSINPTFLIQDIFLYADTDASTVTQGGTKFLQYRYILIPGSVSGRLIKPDWKDYNKIKILFGIKD